MPIATAVQEWVSESERLAVLVRFRVRSHLFRQSILESRNAVPRSGDTFDMANVAKLASDALTDGGGILRLSPTWVPRSFLQPGKRLKLHPNDYYAMGTH